VTLLCTPGVTDTSVMLCHPFGWKPPEFQRFAFSGHFTYMESDSMWSLVHGFFHSVLYLRGSSKS